METFRNDGRGSYKSLEDLAFDGGEQSLRSPKRTSIWSRIALGLVGAFMLYCTLATIFEWLLHFAARGSAGASKDCPSLTTTDVPQYFQTTPELWAGPTATGRAPFLAQTNPVSFEPTATFVPNDPLETAIPIVGAIQNESIFHLMGHLSPYFPNPSGFGVAEYPLPPGANITHVQVSLYTIP
jgi:hypothetical protein